MEEEAMEGFKEKTKVDEVEDEGGIEVVEVY